jgi:hypothetical protein
VRVAGKIVHGIKAKTPGYATWMVQKLPPPVIRFTRAYRITTILSSSDAYESIGLTPVYQRPVKIQTYLIYSRALSRIS